jgi:hypothetical protein
MIYLLLFLFGPCQVINDLVTPVDCSDHTSPMSLAIYLIVLIGAGITVYLTTFHGETEAAKKRRAKVSRWSKSLKDRGGFHELKAWEIALFGSAAGLVLMGAWLYMDGPSFASIVLPLLFSIALVFMVWIEAHKEQEDPHKDIPEEIRMKSLEELKQHNEHLAELNRTRELRGEQNSDIDTRARKLSELKYKRQDLKKKFPNLTNEEINRLVEPDEIREFEKHK